MRTLMILMVKLYQCTLGRLLYFVAGGRSVCIYEPTCSNYMIQALTAHGPIKGLGLGLWRICRCHPFARGGPDPVPGLKTMTPSTPEDSPQ